MCALVAGASRGIGRAVAERLHASGKQVGILSRSPSYSDHLIHQQCDLALGQIHIQNAFKLIVDKMEQKPKYFVYSAGIVKDNILLRVKQE